MCVCVGGGDNNREVVVIDIGGLLYHYYPYHFRTENSNHCRMAAYHHIYSAINVLLFDALCFSLE